MFLKSFIRSSTTTSASKGGANSNHSELATHSITHTQYPVDAPALAAEHAEHSNYPTSSYIHHQQDKIISREDETLSRSNSDLTYDDTTNNTPPILQKKSSFFIPSFVSITRKRSIERRKQIETRTGEWDLNEIVVDNVDKMRRALAAGSIDSDDSSDTLSTSDNNSNIRKTSIKSSSRSIKSVEEDGVPLEDMSSSPSTRHGSVDLGRSNNNGLIVGHAHRGSIDIGRTASDSLSNRIHHHAHRASLDLSRTDIPTSSYINSAMSSATSFTPGHHASHHQRASIDMGAFASKGNSYATSTRNNMMNAWNTDANLVDSDPAIDSLVASVSSELASLKTSQVERR
ncbi:hypothetical protein SmJEL517_g04529 [Synchytrium microbalum]|uniref:Uncharacterized protein n=1 Tax=Synchytrium microbalum TaxID=1806994 RepID=A0A507BRL0_9FUNG|nr:uncharacterized protein SmJEL517_g04529 [Synchytrium microbalum]TPX32320.1 hypothetical protein SmJEL517_g04529 [Synchytrium microbalum]